MSKHISDFLGHLKAGRGESPPLWLWKLLIIATGNGFPECFLPVRTENKHPLRAAFSTLHWGKVGVLFISSFFFHKQF